MCGYSGEWLFHVTYSLGGPSIHVVLAIAQCVVVLTDGRIIDSLLAELDAALVSLQTARKVAAEMQRAREASRRSDDRQNADATPTAPPNPTLRYGGMTVAEAAVALGVSEEQVRRLLRTGELTGVPFRGRVGWRLQRDYVNSLAAAWDEQRRAQEEARRTRRRPRPPQR